MSDVEMFDTFNEEMLLIGADTRANVHAKGLWHQTFHCWIVNQSTIGGTSLLFQLRHKDKDTYPSLLDISCAGHLQAGESVEDGVRELWEELGLTTPFSELTYCGIVAEENIISEQCVDREFNHIFILESDKLVEEYNIQISEVSGLFYINLNLFRKLMSGNRSSILTEGIVIDDENQKLHSVTKEFCIHDFTPMSSHYAEVLFGNLERMSLA